MPYEKKKKEKKEKEAQKTTVASPVCTMQIWRYEEAPMSKDGGEEAAVPKKRKSRLTVLANLRHHNKTVNIVRFSPNGKKEI